MSRGILQKITKYTPKIVAIEEFKLAQAILDDSSPRLVFNYGFICSKMVAFYDYIFYRNTNYKEIEMNTNKFLKYEEDETVIMGLDKKMILSLAIQNWNLLSTELLPEPTVIEWFKNMLTLSFIDIDLLCQLIDVCCGES
eukprot:TRINITY_DN12237_c0_g1_i2.p2 TRINITY_DN12237_c0_g1~~TRINITY_DN12237_c0_g1_i2.p2  ORF type:complete len:140 (+),score=33.28 TRINITY_DN12237_c0_g1_i2:539-958(+)